jgi:L-ascorbate metabolism protein UlaG (beta-lactamase superfamily)
VLHWLGQAGFIVRAAGCAIAIDPYLSNSLARKYRGHEFPHERMMPAPILPGDVRGVNAVLCTHRHSDHMDPEGLPMIAAGNPGCAVVVPRAEIGHAESLGIAAGTLRGMAAGESVSLRAGVDVEAVPAAHEALTVNDKGEHHYLGYILTVAGIRLYHSGDCVPYDGLAAALRSKAVDIALLPVNGRSEQLSSRGFAGNFSFDEAVRLCQDAAISTLVCHHFGMFAFNTVDPNWLTRRIEARGGAAPRCVVPDVGSLIVLRAAVSRRTGAGSPPLP